MLMHKRVSFLLGSGVSFPAGIPSVEELTSIVLSGKGVMRHTDENYYFDQSPDLQPNEYIPRVTLFLNRLKIEIDLYYWHKRSQATNYEDLYYVASQIRDSELFEYDNPAVQPLINKILPEIRPILKGHRSEVRKTWRLHELATEATHFMRDVVWHSLTKAPKRLDHLCCIKDACLDHGVSNVDVFTLNHDTTLEQYFAQNGINVNDGFGKVENGMRYWDPDIVEKDDSRVRFLKLHGSVNWFRFRPNDGNQVDDKIAIPIAWDFWHTQDPIGRRQWPVDGRPMFLAGTFNKMLDYSSGIYADLHYQFYKLLKNTTALIISGYSFRDRGINTRLIDWLYSDDSHRVIAIHPKPDELAFSARGSISNKWDDWLRSSRLSIIPKPIEDTKWRDVASYLRIKVE